MTDINVVIPPKEYQSTPCEGFEERGTEQQISTLYGALAAARGAFGKIVKDKTVKIKMTGGGQFEFSYAPMENLLDATVPALSANGIAIMLPYTRVSQDKCVQFAIVAHKSGGRLVFSYSFTPKPEVKDFGGQLTYYQRYIYRSALSLAADADMDEMPEQSRGEVAAEKVEKPRQLPRQEAKQPEKQRTPPSSPPEQSAGPQDEKKEHALRDMRTALHALGIRQRSDAAAFIYASLGTEPFPLGDPAGSALTIAQLVKITESAVNQHVKNISAQKTQGEQSA